MDMDESSFTEELLEVKKILWGQQVNEELFHRWSQGFQFSPDEPTALVQKEGGPCAVIAPVQAFLFRALLISKELTKENGWRLMTPEKVDNFLCQALTEILRQVFTSDDTPPENSEKPSTSSKLKSIQEQNPLESKNDEESKNAEVSKNEEESMATETSEEPAAQPLPTQFQPDPPSCYCIVFLNQPLSRRISCESDLDPASSAINGSEASPDVTPDRRMIRTEEELFHRNLRLIKVENISQVESVLREKLDTFKGYYGILQFLYSVILTKGVSRLSNEMSEASELIDPVYGHGGQSLINLFISGKGVSYVWDNDKDLGGLQLKGIARQCEVGFLTLLERLRYCEVGTYLKNPKFPVWLLGSETHLTVLFSYEMDLVKPESAGEVARRVFQTYDPDGNNFVQAVLLEDVMRSLGLFADTEYVDIMRKKLDPETLGIVLLNDFMDEFYPNERPGGPDTFTLFHYNGLSRSSTRKVVYNEGNAIILESDVRCLSDDNMLLTCLQTKWPNIDVQWIGGGTPSIN